MQTNNVTCRPWDWKVCTNYFVYYIVIFWSRHTILQRLFITMVFSWSNETTFWCFFPFFFIVWMLILTVIIKYKKFESTPLATATVAVAVLEETVRNSTFTWKFYYKVISLTLNLWEVFFLCPNIESNLVDILATFLFIIWLPIWPEIFRGHTKD